MLLVIDVGDRSSATCVILSGLLEVWLCSWAYWVCLNQLILVDVCFDREQGSDVLLLLFVKKRDEWRQEEEGAFEQNLCVQTGQSCI